MDLFFSNLSQRLRNENDISDITWALCCTNNYFQRIFLEYCFGNLICEDVDYIEREFFENNLRPDFLIHDIKENRYILEVKKYDSNLHNEYKNMKNIKAKAFIANYTIDKQNIYDNTITWHGFVDHLKKAIKKKIELNNPLINGYLKYLISATDYYEGVSMNLTGFQSLHTFVRTIDEIVNQSNIRGLKTKHVCDDGYSGTNIKFYKNRKFFHFWFGITYFDLNDDIYLFIEFFDDCSKSIKETLMSKDAGKYFKKPYKEDGTSIFVEIKKRYFGILCDKEKPFEDQKNLLKKYFEEILKIFEL